MWQRMRWAADLMRRARAGAYRDTPVRARSLTTQFVVGAAGESDRELLQTVERAHRELHLRRAYFSAFHPIPRSPFAELPAEDPLRELRLYQADFMIRDYGFSFADLPFDDDGLLPRDQTPKQAWAERNLIEPIEVNRAARATLLKVPGIGPRAADRIIAAPFIRLDGHRPPLRLRLW